jgi:hypothetical protein
MIRVAAALSSLVLLAASAGCASFQAKRARAERLEKELGTMRYSQPLDQVWQEVRRMLADRGFPLASEDAAAIGRSEMSLAERIFSPARKTYRLSDDVGLLQQMGLAGGKSDSLSGLGLETGWGSKGSPRERFRVEGISDGDEVRVIFTRVVEDVTDHRESSTRDLEMELDFARRVDPAAAERIEAAAAGK